MDDHSHPILADLPEVGPCLLRFFRQPLSSKTRRGFAATLVMVLTGTAPAQVPQFINYQGRVAVNGVNFDGTGQFKFALVNAGASTSYWTNAPDTTPADGVPDAAVEIIVTKGLYSVLLGDATLPHMAVMPSTVFTHPDVRLRVWFDDGTANGSQLLSPDQRIAAVGYAMMAAALQPGANITAGTISAATISGNGAGLTNIPASAVTGTIPASQIASPPPGMLLIPAGEFTLGDTVDGLGNAAPVTVTLSAFHIAVHEVTLSQWQAVYYWAIDHEYGFSHAGAAKALNHPVHTVDWHDCVKWCNARSEMEGLTPCYYTDAAQTMVYKSGNTNIENTWVKWNANGYRLPTEAEWEKAARGGVAGQRFPWGNVINQNLANYIGDTTTYSYDLGPDGYNPIGSVGGTSPATSPVGSFAANNHGLHDMAGNVWEWCWDWYTTMYVAGSNPHGNSFGANRIYRGGACSNSAMFSRTAFRGYTTPPTTYNSLGFRFVRSAAP